MFGFGKKYPPIDEIDAEKGWQVAQGEYNGKVIFTRFNAAYRPIVGHPEYGHQVGIAMPFRAPLSTGLPSPEEGAELQQVEDALCAELETGKESLLVAVITTGGMREFVFYTSAPKRVQEKFERLKTRITTHKIQLMIQPDQSWDTYRRFT